MERILNHNFNLDQNLQLRLLHWQEELGRQLVSVMRRRSATAAEMVGKPGPMRQMRSGRGNSIV